MTDAVITNFRALEQVEIRLDELTTLVVGRNNSGKTSFVNVFEKFYSGDVEFVLEDFPVSRIADIKAALVIYTQSQGQRGAGRLEQAESLLARAVELLPAISLAITIAYDEDESLAPVSELILDLDEDCHEVKVVSELTVAHPNQFLADFHTASQHGSDAADKFLGRRFLRYFKPEYWAVDTTEGSTGRRSITRGTAMSVLSAKFIYAQNKFDDTPSDKTRNLSRTFEAFYKANSDLDIQNLSIANIESALTEVSKTLDDNYETLFGPLFRSLQDFGVESISPIQRPRVVSSIEGAGLMRGSTRIQYPSGPDGTHLPEGHNGLGYSKLIFTILQIIGFHADYVREEPQPALQLLFIEEPEAHLHPQMQETFIRNIREFIRGLEGWNVQVVITTHSSHIVASCSFSCVRYFDSTGTGIVIKDLSRFRQRVHQEVDGDETLRFLQQYMELRRCDMFFADKVILIEGTAERLLLPEMIRRSAPSLANQYISVVEVGDGYALRFRELLGFLGVRTLIVTDLDSVEPHGRGRKCATDAPDAVTSNQTLKEWLPGEKLVRALIESDDVNKVRGQVRVAYQVPEGADRPCARSFEDAFILANCAELAASSGRMELASVFQDETGAALGAAEIEAQAAAIAKRIGRKKTDFAFDVMLLDRWAVPRYIAEGLQWLS
ncbi:AAA family ATPase [Uniformispora flossi]|uniref:AAA family ATPase n=1 Tax=Uniformispora flossi TaxID=3390723 RepID=UPI003C2EDD47